MFMQTLEISYEAISMAGRRLIWHGSYIQSYCQAISKVSNKDLFVYVAFYSRECEFFWTCSFDLNLIAKMATSLTEHFL